MIDDLKPPLDEALLEHFGVKGMRWGIRKPEDPSGRKSSKTSADVAKHNEATKEYMALNRKAGTRTPEEAKKALAANQQKFIDKFGPSEADSKKGLSPEQKATLKKAAVGVAVVGGLAALAYYGNKSGAFKLPLVNGVTADPGKMAEMAGKPLSVTQYSHNVSHSMGKTWGGSKSYITDQSFMREEFTLPKGHVFHRLSLRAEETFSHATYSTTNIEDFNRYSTSFVGNAKAYSENMHHVTWSTKEDFKVPNLTTVLETVREVMHKESDLPISMATPEHALKWYNANSGGRWNSDRAQAVFSALKSKGYSAIVDEMDAGVQGDRPLVIFNADSLTQKTASLISRSDLIKAQSAVTELVDRKL